MKISKARLRKLIREAIGPVDHWRRQEMYAEFVRAIKHGMGWIGASDVKRQWDDMFNDNIDADYHRDLLDMLASDGFIS